MLKLHYYSKCHCSYPTAAAELDLWPSLNSKWPPSASLTCWGLFFTWGSQFEIFPGMASPLWTLCHSFGLCTWGFSLSSPSKGTALDASMCTHTTFDVNILHRWIDGTQATLTLLKIIEHWWTWGSVSYIGAWVSSAPQGSSVHSSLLEEEMVSERTLCWPYPLSEQSRVGGHTYPVNKVSCSTPLLGNYYGATC